MGQDNGKRYDKFVNIHCHSHFSLLDGLSSPKDIVNRTLELGQPASCITDHGVMYSIVDHFQYANSIDKDKGKEYQKAIAGFEAYVVKDHKIKEKGEAKSETENKREHLVLLAKDNEGYKRLMKICSVGTTEGFYYRPRIDDHVIESYGTDGLIGMSACIAGRIAQNILKDRIEEAEKWAIYYYKMFNGNFYLEIQPTKDPEQVKVNLGIIELHKKLGIPIVATSDAHYLQREDSKTHDMLLCIQSGSLITDPNRWRFPGDTFFVASRDEMTQLFKESGHEVLDQRVVEEAMDMTVEIANQCNVTFNWDKHYLPKIDPPADNDEFNKWSANRQSDGSVSADYLRYLCIKGLKTKGLTSKEYRDRLDFELDVIDKMGFPDYFLIFWDIMKYCREEDIPVGPGRGCFSKDNDVVLSNGNKYKINEVKIGDKVVGYDEQEHEVIDTLQYDCNEELVQLQLDDKKIECTKDHKIYAIKEDDWNKGIREPKWYEANEIGPNDYVAELD